MVASTASSLEKITVLVTGGSGLVGRGVEWALSNNNNNDDDSRFSAAPGERWIFLTSKDGDLRSLDETRALFLKYQPTHVLHLAAKVGGLFKNMREKADMFRDNILINDNVLKCAHDFKVRKVVSCLSTCILPDRVASYPITEGIIHDGPPHPSNEGYAYAKRMIDVQNRSYNEQYGDHFTSVIPTNIFGPFDNYDLQDSHVIPGLIHKCYLAIKNGDEKFVVAGSGKPLRQFIYSRDLGRLLVWAMREYPEIGPIILSVPEEEEVTIKQVAEAITRSMGFKGELVFDTTKADGQYKKTVTNGKLMQYLPAFKFTPFEKAIGESTKWFLENLDKCRL